MQNQGKHRQEPRQAGSEEALAPPQAPDPDAAPSAWPCPLPHGAPGGRASPALGAGRASRLRGGELPAPLGRPWGPGEKARTQHVSADTLRARICEHVGAL